MSILRQLPKMRLRQQCAYRQTLDRCDCCAASSEQGQSQAPRRCPDEPPSAHRRGPLCLLRAGRSPQSVRHSFLPLSESAQGGCYLRWGYHPIPQQVSNARCLVGRMKAFRQTLVPTLQILCWHKSFAQLPGSQAARTSEALLVFYRYAPMTSYTNMATRCRCHAYRSRF